jgi:hypothetical protein
MNMRLLALAATVALQATPALANSIYVDVANTSGVEDGTAAAPFDTIQEGLDAALAGDDVLVAPGTYFGPIRLAQDVLLQSAQGPQATVIDAGGADTAVSLPTTGIAPTDVPRGAIHGFTVRNAAWYLFYIASPVNLQSSFLTVESCILESAQYGVGSRQFGVLQMTRTLVRNVGTGIYSSPNGRYTMTNCTFDALSGTAVFGTGMHSLYNTTISNSYQAYNPAYGSTAGSNVNVWNNAVPTSGWSVSNVTEVDPMFVAPPTDYRLQVDSPLVDAGTTATPVAVTYLGAAPDVGAYENVFPVAITSPVAGSAISGTVAVTATADSPYPIASAELWVNGTATGQVATIAGGVLSFSLDTTTISNSSTVLEVRATDAAGNAGQGRVQVNVANDYANPTVQITSPPTTTRWLRGTITVTAAVSDDVGVTRADLTYGTAMNIRVVASTVPVDGVATFSLDTSIVRDGGTGIGVRAWDASGKSGYAQNYYNVDNTAPAVAVTSPANAATVSGTLAVTATVTDNLSGLAGPATLWVNGTATSLTDDVSDGVATFSLDTRTLANGAATLEVRASDVAGNVGAGQVQVTVANDTVAPTVTITSPAANAYFRGTVTVTANVSDDVGVVGGQLLYGWMTVNNLASTATIQNGVATFTFDSVKAFTYPDGTRRPDGYVAIEAQAWDAAGNVGMHRIGITVDNTAPTVAITSPTSGTSITRTVTVTATATDKLSGVASVKFYVDGALRATDTTSPYSFSLDPKTLTKGTHTLTAVATDGAGNAATSAPVSVKR